jgi:hypothetical protein
MTIGGELLVTRHRCEHPIDVDVRSFSADMYTDESGIGCVQLSFISLITWFDQAT